MKRGITLILTMIFCLSFALAGTPVSAQTFVETETFENDRLFMSVKDQSTALGISESKYYQLLGNIRSALKANRTELDIRGFHIVNTNTNRQILANMFGYAPEQVKCTQQVYFSLGSTELYSLQFTYLSDAEERWAECEKAANVLVWDLEESNLTDVQKALILHDRLAELCEYDQANYEANRIPYISHTMYGCLVKRVAVCDGYAKAYQYLLEKVGIQSRLCTSEALGHAWNIVTIDGKEYHVDITWDDPVQDISGLVTHVNFLRSTTAFRTGDPNDDIWVHDATDYDDTPTDTRYDAGFWQQTETSFQYLNGKLYFITGDDSAGTFGLYEWCADGTSRKLVGWNEYWSYYGIYSRLASDGEYLYYSRKQDIYRYDPVTGQTEKVYSPTVSSGKAIYGMRVLRGTISAEVTNSPEYGGDTKRNSAQTFDYKSPETIFCGEITTDKILNTETTVSLWTATGTLEKSVAGNTRYALAPVPDGEYTLKVSKPGFYVSTSTVVGNADRVINEPIALKAIEKSNYDVNGDGNLSSDDAVYMARYLLLPEKYTAADGKYLDFTADGEVTVEDALWLLRNYVLGDN